MVCYEPLSHCSVLSPALQEGLSRCEAVRDVVEVSGGGEALGEHVHPQLCTDIVESLAEAPKGPDLHVKQLE